MRSVSVITRRGFTFVEVAVCIVIVGLGFVATMQLMAVCTQHNAIAVRMAAASSLATNIRELMAHKSFVDPVGGYGTFGLETGETDIAQYNDLDDFDGKTFSPPIEIIDPDHPTQDNPDYSQFAQSVEVTPMDGQDFTKAVSLPADYEAVRVRVHVRYGEGPADARPIVHTLTWIETKR